MCKVPHFEEKLTLKVPSTLETKILMRYSLAFGELASYRTMEKTKNSKFHLIFS
jgi:hypothetical protein